MSVWADDVWMLHPDGGELADELVSALEHEPRGLSCDELAVRLQRRRAEVLDALRSDWRLEHVGGGRGSRWRLVGGRWDGLVRKDRGDRDYLPSRPHERRREAQTA